MVPDWLSRLVPASAKDRYIASLERQLEYFQQLNERTTSNLLVGLNMPGIQHAEPKELPKLKSRPLPSQRRSIYEAQDRKNSLPGEKENHGHAEN